MNPALLILTVELFFRDLADEVAEPQDRFHGDFDFSRGGQEKLSCPPQCEIILSGDGELVLAGVAASATDFANVFQGKTANTLHVHTEY